MYFWSAPLKNSKYSFASATVSKISLLIFIAQYHVKHHVSEYKDKEAFEENSDDPVKNELRKNRSKEKRYAFDFAFDENEGTE